MDSKENIISALRAVKDEIRRNYRVRELGLFGSVVRNEQNEESDVDIMAEFDEDADLFDLMGLSIFLEERLQRKVDVLSKRGIVLAKMFTRPLEESAQVVIGLSSLCTRKANTC